MDGKVLVAYASKYGATREIAEKVGTVLRQSGLPVEVLPVKEEIDLAPYRAVILGSAVYVGKWPKEGAAFLQAQANALAERPFWLFSSGPTGEGDPLELVEGQRFPPALQAVVDRIRPRDIAVFHGYINPQKLNLIEKWAINKLVKKPMGDYRDWQAIENWAQTIAAELQAVTQIV